MIVKVTANVEEFMTMVAMLVLTIFSSVNLRQTMHLVEIAASTRKPKMVNVSNNFISIKTHYY